VFENYLVLIIIRTEMSGGNRDKWYELDDPVDLPVAEHFGL